MGLLIESLRLVPKNALSRAVGSLLRAPLPAPVTRGVIRGFSKAYGVDTSEAEKPVDTYPTFNAFFTRRLKPGARPIPADPSVIVSPVDGTVGQIGQIDGVTLVQAKGRTYTLPDFLVDAADAHDFVGGTFITLYLAPYNYHRIHTPVGGTITGYAHVPGHLWPVNAAGVAEVDRLFAVNERLITYLDGTAGKVAVVKVGATCVGRIRALYDDVVTNDGGEVSFRRVRYDQPLPVDKAGECGVFEMGSTVVLLFQKGRIALEPSLRVGAPIRLGDVLGQIAAGEGR